MFILSKTCHFECNGVIVSVPENYYVYAGPEFIDEDNMLMFKPLDDRYCVIYQVWKHCSGTRESILEFLTEDADIGKDIQYPHIEEIENNGLKGHHYICRFENEQYYEARFLIEETDKGCTQFVFCVTTTDYDIEKIKASPEFKVLLDGIRKK